MALGAPLDQKESKGQAPSLEWLTSIEDDPTNDGGYLQNPKCG